MKLKIFRSFDAPGSHLCGLTWDGRYLWHSDAALEALFAIDPETGTIARRIQCPGVRTDLTFDGAHLWQVVDEPKRLCRVDPESGQILGYLEVEPPSTRLCGIEHAPEGFWMGFHDPGVIELRSRPDLSPLRSFSQPGDVAGLTVVGEVVVYASFREALVRVIDSRTGAVIRTAETVGQPTGLTWDGARFWYCDYPGGATRAFELDW